MSASACVSTARRAVREGRGMKRSLTLKSEHLTELTGSELAAVAGGVPPTRQCPTAALTCIPTQAVREILEAIEIGTVPTDGC